MDTTVKILGQKPQQVNLGGVDLEILPPSFYRTQEIIEAALHLPEALTALKSEEFTVAIKESDEQATLDILKECAVNLVGKSAVALRLICADREGNLPEKLKSDDFWYKEVSLSAIIALIDIFVELIDVENLLKKVALLTGGTKRISRGLTSPPLPARPLDGVSNT